MPAFFLDFETQSRLSVKEVGAHRYAEDPSTRALCAGWALDRGRVTCWRRGQPVDWLLYVQHEDVIIVAHNAEFERLILKYLYHLDLPPSRFRCTAALAARYGLARNLEDVGETLDLTHKKDAKTGKHITDKLCMPRKSGPLKGQFYTEQEVPEDFQTLYRYNIADVEATREIYYTLPKLSDKEQALWELTVRMNDRGLKVDMPAVQTAHALAARAKWRIDDQFERLTGKSPRSYVALQELWGMNSVDKQAVRTELKRTDLPPKKRAALELMQKSGKSSLAKLQAIINRASLDGRYRGGLVYCGAERTGRWSGKGVQLHNLPIGMGADTDGAFLALELGLLETLYPDVLVALSEMLKGFFLGPMLIGDYRQIEARTLAWFAGQHDLVADFAADKDVYSDMASVIYGHPVTKDDIDPELRVAKRQLGKVVILGAGFGLGWARLQGQIEEKFNVGISEAKARGIIAAYRERYPRIPAFWGSMEALYKNAVYKESNRIGFDSIYAGLRTEEFGGRRFAYIQLPSGRPLWYFDPQDSMRSGKWPDGQPKFGAGYRYKYPVRHAGERGGGPGNLGGGDEDEDEGKITYINGKPYEGTYGGKLTENAVQAFARDVMAEALLRLDKAGFPLVLDVHDEVVAEAPANALPEFTRLMEEPPEWTEGLPIAVESYAAGRYHK